MFWVRRKINWKSLFALTGSVGFGVLAIISRKVFPNPLAAEQDAKTFFENDVSNEYVPINSFGDVSESGTSHFESFGGARC